MFYTKRNAIVFAGRPYKQGSTFTSAGNVGEALSMAAKLLADVGFAYIFETFQEQRVHGEALFDEAIIGAGMENNALCTFKLPVVGGVGNGNGYSQHNRFSSIVCARIQCRLDALSMILQHTPQHGIIAMNIEEDQEDTRYGK